MKSKLINASSLSQDPDIAAWRFECAALSADDLAESRDPLNILLQREAAGEYHFHEEHGAQYPHFAPSYN